MTPKEQIVELKERSVRIEFNIEELDSLDAASYYLKRLVQLAHKAKAKYETLKSDVIES